MGGGTVLTCAENFNQYFANSDVVADATQRGRNALQRDRGASSRAWEQFDSRFDCAREPNEVNRFGYVMEVDRYDPTSTPRKHTALGRFKHEGATTARSDDGRVVIYSGDDERFDYFYKFVTHGKFDPYDRAKNMSPLESGTLYVARLTDEGTGEWIPLVPAGPLAGWTRTEICASTRQAAGLVGATAMDRPEDIQVNSVNQRVCLACTNNTRTSVQVDEPNPAVPIRMATSLRSRNAAAIWARSPSTGTCSSFVATRRIRKTARISPASIRAS